MPCPGVVGLNWCCGSVTSSRELFIQSGGAQKEMLHVLRARVELVQVGTPVGAELAKQYHPRSTISTDGPLNAPNAAKAPPPSGTRILKALGLVLVAVFAFAFIAGQIARMN